MASPRIETISQTGVGSSAARRMIYRTGEFAVGFGAVVTGTVNYTVQHTFDGINWFDHEFVASASTDQDGNYAFPVKEIRVTVNSGTGTVDLTSIQAR